jgi:hypothetical protein
MPLRRLVRRIDQRHGLADKLGAIVFFLFWAACMAALIFGFVSRS